MAIGKWKQSARKRGRFIRRALSRTQASQPEIARKAGSSIAGVRSIQARDQIRPPELSRAIGARSMVQTKARMAEEGQSKRRLKKICHYSEAEKTALLKKNKRTVVSIAGKWWKSEIIKTEYGGRFEEFLNDVNKGAFDYLDYFDPKRKTKDGKPANVSAWMGGSAKIHCRQIYFSIKKRAEKQGTIRKSGASEAIYARSWIPASTKILLKKLGLNPFKVAEIGFDDIRKQILAISEESQTGLTPREKKVIGLRLEGKTMPEIAKAMGLHARSGIHAIEGSTAGKIRRRMVQIAGTG